MAKAKLSKDAAAAPKRIKKVRETPEGFDGRSLASRRDTGVSSSTHLSDLLYTPRVSSEKIL